jgi:hypothetical protein
MDAEEINSAHGRAERGPLLGAHHRADACDCGCKQGNPEERETCLLHVIGERSRMIRLGRNEFSNLRYIVRVAITHMGAGAIEG